MNTATKTAKMNIFTQVLDLTNFDTFRGDARESETTQNAAYEWNKKKHDFVKSESNKSIFPSKAQIIAAFWGVSRESETTRGWV